MELKEQFTVLLLSLFFFFFFFFFASSRLLPVSNVHSQMNKGDRTKARSAMFPIPKRHWNSGVGGHKSRNYFTS